MGFSPFVSNLLTVKCSLEDVLKCNSCFASLPKQIGYFNVYSNQMTGTIPSDLRLRQMFYMDLGRNKFRGTLPVSLGENYVRLRHLHLDHNRFTGTVPSTLINAGNGRLNALSLNDNKLTGLLPGNFQVFTRMGQFTAHNNQFSKMDKDICKLNVFENGELAEFKSDCDICVCGNNNIMCDFCVN
jgi:hypothetical protein